MRDSFPRLLAPRQARAKELRFLMGRQRRAAHRLTSVPRNRSPIPRSPSSRDAHHKAVRLGSARARSGSPPAPGLPPLQIHKLRRVRLRSYRRFLIISVFFCPSIVSRVRQNSSATFKSRFPTAISQITSRRAHLWLHLLNRICLRYYAVQQKACDIAFTRLSNTNSVSSKVSSIYVV